MASANYESQRESLDAVAVWTAHIHFPAFESLSAKDFYWATADKIELEDGKVYLRHLTSPPRGRHQTDRGNDYAELNVSNPDNALYNELLPYEDLIEKCQLTIRCAYEIETDYYESEIKYFGYLKDFTVSDDEQSIKITSQSDVSRSGWLVGNRIITRDKCGTEFNVNGLNDPATHKCGWLPSLGGNALFCTKELDGVDGCKAHGNEPRFYAVKGLNTATVEVLPNDDGGGWDYGSGPSCFSHKAYVLMADGSIRPIHHIEREDRVKGLDLFDHDRVIDAEVLDTTKDLVGEIHIAKFDTGITFEVAKEHLFYLGQRLFAPVGVLGERPAFGINSARNLAKSSLMSIERVLAQMFVYNLRTSCNNFFVTDENGQFFYLVHNVKPRYDPGDLGMWET